MASSFNHHIPERSVSSTTENVAESRGVSIDDTSKTAGAEKPALTLPPVIPSGHQHRTLVLCFDGTGDQFDNDNSNIVQFVSLLKKDDRQKQCVYYQTGIGTYTGSNRSVSIFKSGIRKIIDTMFAHSIDAHIMGGYKFLMQNSSQVCFTKLPPSNSEQVPFAYTMYLRTDGVGWEQANEFKRAFSINVEIEFLGVWDTVGSIGFKPWGLPFATCNRFIKTYRHAVSLDERRAKFQVNLWNKPSDEEAKLGLHEHQEGNGKPETDIKEVWFAGCHCDVGGGSVSNTTENSLARIPLRWMVREVFRTNAGILFLTDRLPEIGLNPSTIYPVVLDRPDPRSVKTGKISEPLPTEYPTRPSAFSIWGKPINNVTSIKRRKIFLSEEDEELKDALSPIHDQMVIKPWWWLFEYLPLPLRRQWGPKGEWDTSIRCLPNRGSARAVDQSNGKRLKVHRSVKMRMDAEYEDEHKRRKRQKYRPGVLTHPEGSWLFQLGVKTGLLNQAPDFVDPEWVE
ncbi:hypothetical protein EST38_g7911 [Candolleomyces aberdarensis]|uniref:T6SS Phospholipase effector Tle1-like catalytic domain-containing protein n=1 Tax=Candolleomyces aberdarensis TaxID=2316362 RepID=A0A4Q2DDY7_9AGAR|nr:hypothetical protein EST38_g7911 [Candolleomyces aberdarensis]